MYRTKEELADYIMFCSETSHRKKAQSTQSKKYCIEEPSRLSKTIFYEPMPFFIQD